MIFDTRPTKGFAVTLVAAALAALAFACSDDGGEREAASPARLGQTRQAVVIPPTAPPSLKTVTPPRPSNLSDFVRDEAAAIRLGKALFWDMQVGADGVTACASCHFHAGADDRAKNQLAPGHLRVSPDGTTSPDDTFAGVGGPNHVLVPSDFPFRKLANPDDRGSVVLRDSNDVASSQGVHALKFVAIVPGLPLDLVTSVPDPDGFRVGHVNVRRVEPRNTPTVVNAVFNERQFWDGRAQAVFNGVDVWGTRNPNAYLYKRRADGTLEKTTVAIPDSSLASQAVGPPLSSLEMSADGRTFQEVGDGFVGSLVDKTLSIALGRKLLRKTAKKLLSLEMRPLGKQRVHAQDSVLGAHSRWPATGLSTTYEALVKQAFQPAWWSGAQIVRIEPDGSRTLRTPTLLGGVLALGTEEYTQMEYNFSLFFGLAIQLYEATLVANDTPFDRFREGDLGALTPQEQEGLALFSDTVRVRCVNCHGGAELTEASSAKVKANRLRRREGNVLDRGFNNIGLRPTFEDLGVGSADAITGKPLSEARLARVGEVVDPTLSPPLGPADVVGVDGAFKTPGLRNVALTGPYFHTGSMVTLRQVVELYSRGGDFQPIAGREGPISPLNTPNLTEGEKQALVAFLRALTDERVRFERAPFDHPELFVPDGHPGNETAVTNRGDGAATDTFRTLPAVGAQGGAALGSFLGQ